MPSRKTWTEEEARAFARSWAANCAGPVDEEWPVHQLMAAPPPTDRQLWASSALAAVRLVNGRW
jgi:hypothetical protein